MTEGSQLGTAPEQLRGSAATVQSPVQPTPEQDNSSLVRGISDLASSLFQREDVDPTSSYIAEFDQVQKEVDAGQWQDKSPMELKRRIQKIYSKAGSFSSEAQSRFLKHTQATSLGRTTLGGGVAAAEASEIQAKVKNEVIESIGPAYITAKTQADRDELVTNEFQALTEAKELERRYTISSQNTGINKNAETNLSIATERTLRRNSQLMMPKLLAQLGAMEGNLELLNAKRREIAQLSIQAGGGVLTPEQSQNIAAYPLLVIDKHIAQATGADKLSSMEEFNKFAKVEAEYRLRSDNKYGTEVSYLTALSNMGIPPTVESSLKMMEVVDSLMKGDLSLYSEEGQEVGQHMVKSITGRSPEQLSYSGADKPQKVINSLLKDFNLNGDYDIEDEDGFTAESVNKGRANLIKVLSDPSINKLVASGEIQLTPRQTKRAVEDFETIYATKLHDSLMDSLSSEINGVSTKELFTPEVKSGRISIRLTDQGSEMLRKVNQDVAKVGRVAGSRRADANLIKSNIEKFKKAEKLINNLVMAKSTLEKTDNTMKSSEELFFILFGDYNANPEQTDNQEG